MTLCAESLWHLWGVLICSKHIVRTSNVCNNARNDICPNMQNYTIEIARRGRVVNTTCLYSGDLSLKSRSGNRLSWDVSWFHLDPPGKSMKEKVRNGTIRAMMLVGKRILEIIEEKRLRWFGRVKWMPGNRLPLKILEWEPEETRRSGRPEERWIDKPWTDRRGY
jgi:hypothetical protein